MYLLQALAIDEACSLVTMISGQRAVTTAETNLLDEGGDKDC